MRVTVDPGFTTPAMSGVFSLEDRLVLFCRFEAELAAAQAELEVISDEAAAEIAGVCARPPTDAGSVLAEGWERGTPVVALLDSLRAGMTAETARWIHHGATTQDVVDTALILQMKAGLVGLADEIVGLRTLLAALARRHGQTTTMGRTFLQPAAPTTVGARVALWLAPLIPLTLSLRAAAADLPLQLGGPVGDAAGFDRWPEVAGSLAARLGLVAPLAPWHTDRTPITATAGLLGRLATSVGKIATDVALLSGLGEVRVRSGVSSSMPDKRNPIDALRALAAIRVCHSAVAGLVTAPSPGLERSVGAWHAESVLVPSMFETAAAAVEGVRRSMETVEFEGDGADTAAEPLIVERILSANREET